jgi:GDP-L-fucose synthase
MIHTLNLVFDKWNGKKYITNLSPHEYVNDTLPYHVKNAKNINIKYCRMSDISNDKNFYYIISYKQYLFEIMTEQNKCFLSDEVIDAIKYRNLKVLLLCEHEVNNNEFITLKTLKDEIERLGLKEDSFYYVNNNSLLEEYAKELKTKINVHSIKFLFEYLVGAMKNHNFSFEPNKKFLFTCMNKTGKEHRVLTIAYLKKYGILEDTDWSFIDKDKRAENVWFNFQIPKIKDLYDDICEAKKITGKLSEYEKNDGWLEKLNSDTFNPSDTIQPLTFLNSYINIVTESMFYHGVEVHISEKSFRPFYFYQLPIFVTSHRHIEFLKKTYNFDFFDDLIDHSYDKIKDNDERFFAVMEEIKRLHGMKDEIIEFYIKNEHRFKKNREIIDELYDYNPVSKYFIELIEEKPKRETYFVFDKWDGEAPIPNSLGLSNVRDHLTPFIFDNKQYPVKLCGLDGINEKDNFYYVVNYTHDLKQTVNDKTFLLNDKVIDVALKTNLKIILINEHEINLFEKDVLTSLICKIRVLGLKEENFYYLNNNSKLELYKQQLKTKINVYTMRFLFEILVESMLIHETEYVEDKPYLFMCHNRVSKEHRLVLLSYLKRSGIINDVDWSFLNPDEPVDSFVDEDDKSLILEYNEEINYFKEIRNHPSKFEKIKNWHNETGHNPLKDRMMTDTYINSYINIITETVFGWYEVHISEKSFRPFYFFQLPLFVASYRHVDYMRTMYGFDFFDDLIDHSYDSEPNNTKRMNMLFDEIKRLHENKDVVIEFYKNNKDRIVANYKLLISLYNEKQTLKYFNSLTDNHSADLRPNPIVYNKKVLITGSNGLVGRHLVKKCLESGYHVTGVDNVKPEINDYHFILADLTKPHVIENLFDKNEFDVVYNCFGVKGSPLRAKNRPVDFLYPSFKINTEIINQCQKNNIWLVFVSSVGVYSPAETFVEDDVWKTLPGEADWFPSWSKRMGELLLEAYKVQYGYDRWSIIRPANIFGEYDDFSGNGTVIASTIKKISEATDKIVAWGDGSPIRDFVYAGDVADALIHLYKEKLNITINFGSGENITIKDMIEQLIKISMRNIKIEWDDTKPNGDLRRQMDITKQTEYKLLPKLGFNEALRLTYKYYINKIRKKLI